MAVARITGRRDRLFDRRIGVSVVENVKAIDVELNTLPKHQELI